MDHRKLKDWILWNIGRLDKEIETLRGIEESDKPTTKYGLWVVRLQSKKEAFETTLTFLETEQG
jgi:hypothetical protein